MFSRLSICIFVPTSKIVHSLTELLSGQRYHLHIIKSAPELSKFVLDNKEQLDCLIFLNQSDHLPIIQELYEQGIILPAIVIEPSNNNHNNHPEVFKDGTHKSKTHEFVANIPKQNQIYHSAEVRVNQGELASINQVIDKAISQFLHLAPSCALSDNPQSQILKNLEERQNFLLLQQRRLAEKLKERLGYLGVYYKRNPSCFYRHFSEDEKVKFIQELSEQYREIILDYFNHQSEVNQLIDQFVNQAFFADISVSQILEIHMELMDEFAQQLKLEGRNEDILLDYRLALIDLIAHLCEMYRRSIPKEDIPFDMLFPVD